MSEQFATDLVVYAAFALIACAGFAVLLPAAVAKLDDWISRPGER